MTYSSLFLRIDIERQLISQLSVTVILKVLDSLCKYNSCTMVWDLYLECSFMYSQGHSLREYIKLQEGYKSHTP